MPELHFLKVQAIFGKNLVSTKRGANKCRFNAHVGLAGATEKYRKKLLCTLKNIWVLLRSYN